jgi:hypothetical protein
MAACACTSAHRTIRASISAIGKLVKGAATNGKAFLADAAKISCSVMPLSGEEVARIVRETVNAPPNVVAKAKAVIGTTEPGE